MRNKLITEGKLVSYGIYFDVNKDGGETRILWYTEKALPMYLQRNAGVKVKIVGHTDADGDNAANLICLNGVPPQ